MQVKNFDINIQNKKLQLHLPKLKNMYTGLLHLHNLMRWIILILLVINIVRHVSATSKPFTAMDKKLGLWLMISAHITLLLGLYQYFFGGSGFAYIQQYGMSTVMQNSVYRFWAVEHITGMLIAIIIITIGRGVSKKTYDDAVKHKRSAILFIAALLIIIAVIPWPGREEGISRALFPGM